MKDRLVTIGTTVLMLAGLAFLGFLGWQWWQSRLPARYDVMDYGVVDRGGGPPAEHVHFSVADTKVPAAGKPDVRVTLTAQKSRIRLASGKEVDAWTFNGRAPGPEIRVERGQLLEVTLVNKDIDDGVTIHWHGVDVPNTEDGVAGVTQDAVPPGGRYVYRFRPEQVGTFWYHTHQNASDGVEKGLYGSARGHARDASGEGRGHRRAGPHLLRARRDRDERRPGAPRSTSRSARAPEADRHGQQPCEVPAVGNEAVRRGDRRRGDRTGSRPGGRGDRDRRWRPLRPLVPASQAESPRSRSSARRPGSCSVRTARESRSRPFTVVFDPCLRAPERSRPGPARRSTARSSSTISKKRRLSRRQTRPALGAEREALPTRAHVRGREGRSRRSTS